MSDPIDLTITKKITPDQYSFVRIEGRDGSKALIQIDISPADYVSAQMGETVIASLNRGRG